MFRWKEHRKRRQVAFTLIELLLITGIITAIASVTVIAINPRKMLTDARDIVRIQNSGHIQNAMYQYLIHFETLPNAAEIPEGREQAVQICQRGVADTTCANIDPLLVPEYIAFLPVDPVEPCAEYTGYLTYQLFGRPRVVAKYRGLLPGDTVNPECPIPEFTPLASKDDGDSGFTPQGGWPGGSTPEGYKGDYVYRDASEGTNHARWSIDLPAPGQYEVLASWVAFSQNATDAEYHVNDGSTHLATINVDQHIAPSDLQYDGVLWSSLGVHTFTSATLNVLLYANPNGRVVADGIAVRAVL